MSTARAAAALVGLVSDFIKGLSDEDVDALLSGKVGLHITGRDPVFAGKRRPPPKAVDLAAITDALHQASSRQDAAAVLGQEGVSKAVLERLARRMDLPVLRSDSVERLRQRIVESAVGYRINSEAIQGVHTETSTGQKPPNVSPQTV